MSSNTPQIMATDDSAPHIPGYRILNLIGSGANATVYLALQESLNRHVALKILQKFDRPAQAVRFFNEGQIVASMNHPNIITIYDIGSVGSQQYIAMEHLDGGSLRDRIKDKPSPSDALDIVQSIGSALDFVHQMGIVHRDIKPENILFHKRGIPKITDFGVAKALDRDMNLTMDGTALGSPYYLSPEQAEGKDLDGRSDIYSLGVILFEMLAGHKPYLGESQIEVIFGHLNKPIPSLPKEYHHYQGLVEKMMAKNADDRFASAQEMLEYMNSLRSGATTGKQAAGMDRRAQSRSDTTEQGNKSVVQSHPWLLASLIAGSVAAGAAAWLLPWSSSQPPTATEVIAERSMAQEATGPATTTPTLPPSTDVEEPNAATTEEAPPISAALTDQAKEIPEPLLLGENSTSGESPALEAEQASTEETTVSQPVGASADKAADGETAQAEATADSTPEEEDTATRIESLLADANTALKKYRLTSPKTSSAYYYYREVLKLDPHNRKASRGIRRIAEKYAQLADKALKKGDETKSRTYVKRGLSLNPRSKKLLAMQQHLDELEAARLAPPPPPPPPPKPAAPPPKPEPVNNGLQLLDSLE